MVRSRMVPGDLTQPTSPSWTNSWSGQALPNGGNYSATYQTATLDIGTVLTATLSKTSGTYPLSLWFESPLGVWFAEGTTTGTLQATLTLDEQGVWTIYVGVSGSASSAVDYSLSGSAMKVNSLTDLNYTYDAAGNAGSVTDSSALFANQGGQTTYTYGAMNELKTITNQSASGSSGITAKCVTMSYNADGSLDEITRYNGATASGTAVATTEYRTTTGGAGSGYDAMGRITAMQQVYGLAHHDDFLHLAIRSGKQRNAVLQLHGRYGHLHDRQREPTHQREPDERELLVRPERQPHGRGLPASGYPDRGRQPPAFRRGVRHRLRLSIPLFLSTWRHRFSPAVWRVFEQG